MNSNRGRLVTLQGKRNSLLRDEGGIQKIKQCVRALIRNERQQEHYEDEGELSSECVQLYRTLVQDELLTSFASTQSMRTVRSTRSYPISMRE